MKTWQIILILISILILLFVLTKPREIVIQNDWSVEKMTLAEVSAYTSEEAQTDNTPETMASGKKVYDGAIACPGYLDFGDQLEIQGKSYTCEDRMNKRYRDGNYFDIWFSDKSLALEFGRKELLVIIK